MKHNSFSACSTSAILSSHDPRHGISGIAARLFASFASWSRPVIDPKRVEHLGETIAAQPALRQWLLVIASEPSRSQRALLARAAQAMRGSIGNVEASEALEQLADARLMRAVTEYLLRQTGLQPLGPTERKGRGARLRLDALGSRLQERSGRQLAV